MNDVTLSLLGGALMGLSATLTTDMWALFLKRSLGITSPSYCLVGRWLRTMPEGIFKHSNIASAPQKNAECMAGWVAHYIIGVMFAIAFVGLVGDSWLQHPTLKPAITFGVVTVLMPFFIMQPAIGLGFAASKASDPAQARLRSFMNHTVFGIGLYIFGLLANWLL